MPGLIKACVKLYSNILLDSVRVLIKYLLHDDKNCVVRQQMGQSNVWAKDLLPILLSRYEDNELFLVTVRLMLNLSMPTRKIFQEKYGNEEFPKDAEFQYNFESVQRHLFQYKESFSLGFSKLNFSFKIQIFLWINI